MAVDAGRARRLAAGGGPGTRRGPRRGRPRPRANNGRPLSPDAVSTFNAAAATARLSPELDQRGAVRLEPYAHGVDASLGRIVAVALGAMLDGSWSRLKACRNCRWAFHDYSRNRSASWCSMLLCGGRHKTRAYRRRLKARQA